MDLQTRKLMVIEKLIQLDDDQKIGAIEDIIFSYDERESVKSKFSEQEVIYRTKLSEKQFEEGKFTNQDQLEKESENW